MSKAFRGSMVALALGMVAVAMLAVGLRPAAAAAFPDAPATCDPMAIYNYCMGMDGFALQEACKAELTAELCGGTNACGLDSRVNTNCSAPEILYCNGDDAEFYKYDYATGKGNYHFSIPLADLNQDVKVKTLLKQVGQVKVYLLPDGTVELLAPQPDGKIYFMIFDPGQCSSLQESAEWGLK